MKLKDIITQETLLYRAEELKSTGAKPGFDGMTAEAAALWLQVNGQRLLRDLADGGYRPMPAVGYNSAKAGGGYRNLTTLTVIDRIIQLCLLDAMDAACEEFFSPYSWAYRRGRGTGDALKQYCLFGERYRYASKTDPAACFDNMDHDVLMKAAADHFKPDAALAALLKHYIELPVCEDGRIETRDRGILQGAPLSPLMCNLYMHGLDCLLTERGIPFIRYADDTVIFADSAQELEAYTAAAEEYMTGELKLNVNRRKSGMGTPETLQFLGHAFTRDRRGMLALKATDQAERAFFAWHHSKPANSYRTVDILSDGVLRQKELSLFFDSEENGGTSIPIKGIDRINIYSNVVLDSGFIQKALDNGIYINLFDRYGSLKGRFYPHTALNAPLVTFQQIVEYSDPEKRLVLAKEFVSAAIHNMRLNLYYHRKHSAEPVYDEALNAIKTAAGKIRQCADYEALLLLEASAHRAYYGCFDTMVRSDELVFDKRTRRPPRSEINSMISFGNTVLYDMIAFRINKSSLDCRIGFLHATNSTRTESLQLDVAEIFKPLLVDRVIFSLCNLHSIRPEHFVREENGAVYMTEAGKRIFLKGFYGKLDDGLTVKGRYYTYKMLMDEEVQKRVRHFKKGEDYKAFRQVQ